jgi:hypothetical protein
MKNLPSFPKYYLAGGSIRPDRFFEFPGEESVKLPQMDFDICPGLGPANLDQGNSLGAPIPFSKELARTLHAELIKNYDKDLRFVIVPDYIKDIVGNEFKRWLCALEAYRQSPNPVLPFNWLVDGILIKDFAEDLKKIRLKSILESTGNQLLEYPEGYHSWTSYKIQEVGDVFNYNYWFNWEMEPEDDITQYGFKDISKITTEDCNLFKEILFDLLPDDIEEVLEEEVLLNLSNSSSLVENSSSTEVKYKQQERDGLRFSKQPLTGKAVWVQTAPATGRNALILSVPQSNSVRLIEKQVALIARKCPFSQYIADPIEFEKNLESFNKRNRFFFNRDIEKDGITKPRELIKLTLDVLESKYPGFAAWKYRGIFSDLFVWINSEKVNPPRGVGLGFSAALTTLIQAAIFRIIFDEASEKDFIAEEIDAIFYHDDATIGFKSKADMYAYLDYEDQVFQRYQLIRKAKKSHYGRLSIHCEIYHHSVMLINEKISYKLTELYNLFSRQNIVDAKWSCQNMSRHVSVSDISSLMEELIAFWGYEFYPEEWSYPASLGGWFNPTLLGVRLDALVEEFSFVQKRAFISVAENMVLEKKPSGEDRIYISPLRQLYGDLDLGSIKGRMFYDLSVREVNAKLGKFKDRGEYEAAFRRLLRKRRKVFNKKISRFWGIEGFYSVLTEYYPGKDFLPHKDIVTIEEIPRTADIYERYSSPNPLLSYLAYLNPGKFSKLVIPERYSYLCQPKGKQMTASERKAVIRYNNLSRDNPIVYPGQECYREWFPSEKGMKLYYQHHNVVSAFETMYGIYGLPIPDKGQRSLISHEEYLLLKVLSVKKLSSHLHNLVREKGLVTLRHLAELDDEELYNEIRYGLIPKPNLKKKEEPPQEVEEILPIPKQEPREDDSPALGLSDYWTWNQDKTRPVANGLVEEIFQKISVYVTFMSIGDSLVEDIVAHRASLRADLRNDPDWLFIRLVWARSGGRFDSNGDLELTGEVDIFADDSSDVGLGLDW